MSKLIEQFMFYKTTYTHMLHIGQTIHWFAIIIYKENWVSPNIATCNYVTYFSDFFIN